MKNENLIERKIEKRYYRNFFDKFYDTLIAFKDPKHESILGFRRRLFLPNRNCQLPNGNCQ